MPAETLVVRVRKSVGAFQLDVAFEARPGITALFGPSGAGKTTTLSIIAGLVRPDEGTVALGSSTWFDGARSIDVAPESRGIAFVFQSLALFPHLTVLENVEYGVDRALPKNERRQVAREMLARMQASHVEDREPSTLSGGEAQRVALARALARSPRLILLDEAFSGTESALRGELGQRMRELVGELEVPAIVVTHQASEARALSERAVLIEHGRVLEVGPASELIPHP